MTRVVLNIDKMLRLVNDKNLYRAIPALIPLESMAATGYRDPKVKRGCYGCKSKGRHVKGGEVFTNASNYLKRLYDENQTELLNALKNFLHTDELVFYARQGNKIKAIHI